MTPTKARIALALAGAALTAAAWTSGAAAADRIEVASRVTLAQADPFHGKVVSRKAACERGRTVAVYRVEQGPDDLYGSTASDAQSKWFIPAGMPSGKFYAVVKQPSVDAPGKTFVCKRATSPKVRFLGSREADANRSFGGCAARGAGSMMFSLHQGAEAQHPVRISSRAGICGARVRGSLAVLQNQGGGREEQIGQNAVAIQRKRSKGATA